MKNEISIVIACLLFMLLSKAHNEKTNTYYVSENRSCNASLNDSCVECQPLMWFVNRTHTIPNDSTIIFLPGEHSLNGSKVKFYSKVNLTLMGIGSSKKQSSVICSGRQSGFLFQNSSNVTVINLSFQGCGAYMPNKLFGCVFFDHSYDITISQVWIREGKGFGLHIGDCCGSIIIEDSYFTENKNGNVVVWLKACAGNNLTQTYLSIRNSSLQNGYTQTEFEHATGMFLKILRGGVNISLTHLVITNNTGKDRWKYWNSTC